MRIEPEDFQLNCAKYIIESIDEYRTRKDEGSSEYDLLPKKDQKEIAEKYVDLLISRQMNGEFWVNKLDCSRYIAFRGDIESKALAKKLLKFARG